jgi:hypothetical protein
VHVDTADASLFWLIVNGRPYVDSKVVMVFVVRVDPVDNGSAMVTEASRTIRLVRYPSLAFTALAHGVVVVVEITGPVAPLSALT